MCASDSHDGDWINIKKETIVLKICKQPREQHRWFEIYINARLQVPLWVK